MMKHVVQAIKAASHHVAKNDIRHYMNGVALYIKDNQILSVAASDGHKMCTVGDHNFNPNERDIIIIDRSNIPTLLIALDHCSVVKLGYMIITIGDYTIPTIDGNYPDIRRVLPDVTRNVNIDHGICFVPEYLASIDKSRKDLVSHLKSADRKKVSVKCNFGGSSEAGLFTIKYFGNDGDIDDCRITIMPQRM